MKAILLSAGFGERLKPLTNNLPKVMVKVNRKPCLQYNIENLKKQVLDALLDKLTDKIPSIIRMFLGSNVDQMMKDFFEKEGDALFNELIDKFKEVGLENLNIREIVIERINELDFIEFEKIIFGLMSRELKHIEIIGLILGSLIGVIQYVITIFL